MKMNDETKSLRNKFEKWVREESPYLDQRVLKIDDEGVYECSEILHMFAGFVGGLSIKKGVE
jgi:hypothetical protein